MFSFETGIVNVWEKRIFDHQDQERLMKAPDRETAFLALFDTDIGEIAEKQEKDIEDLLLRDMQNFRDKMWNLLKNGNSILFYFLFLKYDALNIKIFLKKKVLGEGSSYFDLGGQDVKYIERHLNHEDRFSEDINPILHDLFEYLDQCEMPSDARSIEKMVDAAYFYAKLKYAKEYSFLFDITKCEIDIANIKNALRGGTHMIEGGNLSKHSLDAMVRHQSFVEELKDVWEIFPLQRALDKVNKRSGNFENIFQEAFSEIIYQKAKETGQGMEKILSFFHKKINAYSNIRLIFFARDNDVSVSEIEHSLLPL